VLRRNPTEQGFDNFLSKRPKSDAFGQPEARSQASRGAQITLRALPMPFFKTNIPATLPQGGVIRFKALEMWGPLQAPRLF
jgi:hypothetical protein